MTNQLNVHLLPELANPHDLAGHTSIVIDTLRASTTITTALENGAEKIIPCLTVEEARQLAADRPGALLGGERGGKPLPGFDFGNSPAEYVAKKVAGKTIVFTTTNGTKAMTRCMGSARILIGSLVNRTAVCEDVLAENDQIHSNASDSEPVHRVDIVCAGTNGEFSMEDLLAAGAIVARLVEIGIDGNSRHIRWDLNDGARVAQTLWGRSAMVEDMLAISQGGRNLIDIGMQSDLSLAADVDRYTRVPFIDKSVWEIR